MSNVFRRKILSDNAISKICELWNEEEREILEFQQGTLKISLEKQVRHYFGHLYFRHKELEDQLIAMSITIKDNYPLLLQIKKFEELALKLANPDTFKKTNISIVKGGGIAGAINLKNINTFSETLSNSRNRALSTSRSEDMTNLEDELWNKDSEYLKNNIEINIKSLDTAKKLDDFVVSDDILESPSKLNKFFNFFDVPRQVIESNQKLTEIQKKSAQVISSENEETYGAIPNPTGIATTLSGAKNRQYGVNSSEAGAASVNNRKHRTEGESWVEANAIVKTLRTRLPKLRSRYWCKLLIWFTDCYPKY